MHMPDALLSVPVSGALWLAGAGAVAYATAKTEHDHSFGDRLPVMAVSGAFVFAAQMIQFTIPGTGASGHIGGGVLLAALLGGCPAMITMTAVLVIQCLFFADGGVLALGLNLLTMGFFPCLVAYPLLFRPIVKRTATRGRIVAASLLTAVAGLQLGAFAIVLATWASGITALPVVPFALLMQPIHLLIGIGEGLITASILCFAYRARPDLFVRSDPPATKKPLRRVVLVTAAAALCMGMIFSGFSAKEPDGLNWAIQKTTTSEPTADGLLYEAAAALQQAAALLPDYAFRSAGAQTAAINRATNNGKAVAGLVGGALTFLAAGGTGLLIHRIKLKKRSAEAYAESD